MYIQLPPHQCTQPCSVPLREVTRVHLLHRPDRLPMHVRQYKGLDQLCTLVHVRCGRLHLAPLVHLAVPLLHAHGFEWQRPPPPGSTSGRSLRGTTPSAAPRPFQTRPCARASSFRRAAHDCPGAPGGAHARYSSAVTSPSAAAWRPRRSRSRGRGAVRGMALRACACVSTRCVDSRKLRVKIGRDIYHCTSELRNAH
jgi:hypothetical protein